MGKAAKRGFSEREFQIFEVIAANPDFSNADIAKVCRLTPRQVKRDLTALYEKLRISGRGARRLAADLYKEATTWSISQRHNQLEAAAALRLLLEKQIDEAQERSAQIWIDARRTTNHIGRIGGDEADPHWLELEERLYRAAEAWRSEIQALTEKRDEVSEEIENILQQTIEEDKHEAAERWLTSTYFQKSDATDAT